MSTAPQFSLETTFSPGEGGDGMFYRLEVTNNGDRPIRNFRLCTTAPTRVNLDARFDNATMTKRFSNFFELAAPDGFVLKPGAAWTVSTGDLGRPLHHWSDGANSAWLVLDDGSVAPLAVTPMRSTSDNAPAKRGAARFAVPKRAPASISVVPWPRQVAVEGRREPPSGLFVAGEAEETPAVAAVFADIATGLFPAEGIARSEMEGGFPVRLLTDETLAAEGYRLGFGADEIILNASGYAGFLYGLVTLGQILRGARAHPETYGFPTGGVIEDAPYYRWRGSHLDVSRRFYGSAEVGHFLRIMAWNKLNRFHWHLTDDEGWRVEIDAYPQLTAIGAWRGQGLPMPPLFASGASRTGGYYTKEAVREIVAQAGRYGMEVVPEIDVPGHSFAALAAVPELADPDETGEYYFHDNFPNGCLNPAREETYAFVERVFGELIELFPSRYFHVGADEVPEGAWSGSPQAKAMLERLGGGGPPELQAAFLKRVQKFLTSKGRITGAWEEAAMGGGIDKANCYLVGWTKVEVNAELAAQGYDIVVAPGQAYYLDMANGAAFSEPGASWAGWSGPRETYSFDPEKNWTAAQKQHLLGVQACIWSEHLTDRAIFDRMVFPRLSAIAETGWTEPKGKSWPRFAAMVGLMPIMYGNWEE